MTGEQAIERVEKALAEAEAVYRRALAPVHEIVEQSNEGARLIGESGTACLAQWFGARREREHGE